MAACRIINIKAGRVGGFSEEIAIHDMCEGLGIPNWWDGMLETGVGAASNLALASLSNFTLPATLNVPEGMGLGISINEKVFNNYTLTEATYGKK